MHQIHRQAFSLVQLALTATFVAFLSIDAPLADAKPSSTPDSQKTLKTVLAPAIKAHRGDVAIAVKHLKSGDSFEHNAERPMPTASLIKFPVMVAAYEAVDRGELALDDMIELKEEDKVPGSGVLTEHFSPGTKISLGDAIHLMIVYSDNTATNLVLDKLGLEATNELMDSLDFPETRIHSKVYRADTSIAPKRSKQFGLGSTTAADLVKLAEMLYEEELVSQVASKQMLEHLFACDDKQKVPRFLPSGTRVAHKTGSVSASRTDAGIMDTPSGPIAFCILTTNNKDRRWTDNNEGDLFCAQIGSAVYQFFNSEGDVPVAPVARTLQMGADGDLVSALQRTLNARIKSRPGIGVDGDFGPETEGAVKQFQKQEGLDATGVVDRDTWKALGPLIMEEKPAPEPAVANAAVRQKSPPDPLNGSPYVTCKAWAIIDGDTGELLAGNDEDVKRDPASTTKMMTAFVVTSLAEEDPGILDETVTFSERADKTSGSTSDVKAGEKAPVRELLYGLLLPSGNDASVALAEHFGKRFSESSAADDKTIAPYDAFIKAMNRKAAEIGMTSTKFKNPHGLTSEGHKTTARDLAKLAHEAFKHPLFRRIVATPQRGATLDSVSGYQRNVLWKSTNQLLRIEGYDGIKTGTTGAAGACLVSTGKRDGHRLMVVVLGATSGDSRYVDSRNLYRWAWNELVGLDDSTSQLESAISNTGK